MVDVWVGFGFQALRSAASHGFCSPVCVQGPDPALRDPNVENAAHLRLGVNLCSTATKAFQGGGHSRARYSWRVLRGTYRPLCLWGTGTLPALCTCNPPSSPLTGAQHTHRSQRLTQLCRAKGRATLGPSAPSRHKGTDRDSPTPPGALPCEMPTTHRSLGRTG